MKKKSLHLSIDRHPGVLFLLYVSGYALYALIWSTGFDIENIDYLSQHLNPAWLQEDFWGALFYLHSQPPLWNAIIGIAYSISPQYYPYLLGVFLVICGGTAVYYINKTLVVFGISLQIRTLLLSALCLFPTIHLYGTWYFYTHFELMLCSVLLYHLSKFTTESDAHRKHLAIAYLMLALLGLTRSQWHLLILCAMSCMLGVLLRKHRRIIACYSLIFILPLCLLYTKNYMVFGFWGSSSWMGSNFAQAVYTSSNKAMIRDYKEQKLIHPAYPLDVNMVHVMRYFPSLEEETKLHTVLHSPYKKLDPLHYNANYLGIIFTARQDWKDSLFILKQGYKDYLRYVLKRFWIVTCQPSAFHPYQELPSIRHRLFPITALFCLGALFLYGLAPLLSLWIAYRNKTHAGFLTILWLFANGMLLLSCAFNGIEQERMRWAWQPIYIIFIGIFVENIATLYSKRRATRPT